MLTGSWEYKAKQLETERDELVAALIGLLNGDRGAGEQARAALAKAQPELVWSQVDRKTFVEKFHEMNPPRTKESA